MNSIMSVLLCFINNLDIQCDNLSTPSKGQITSCSSGRVGVGYEGDTCNFTCNNGYELTGSDARTCQRDGSWSGNNGTCNPGIVYNILFVCT